MKTEKAKKQKPVNSFIYWTPRALSILFLFFLMLFSLDVFGQGYGFWGTILAFLMHNIPVFILTALLVISWKREWVGGITFILAGFFYIFFILFDAVRNRFEWYMLSYSFIIAGPAFFIGIMFLVNWRRRNNSKRLNRR